MVRYSTPDARLATFDSRNSSGAIPAALLYINLVVSPTSFLSSVPRDFAHVLRETGSKKRLCGCVCDQYHPSSSVPRAVMRVWEKRDRE